MTSPEPSDLSHRTDDSRSRKALFFSFLAFMSFSLVVIVLTYVLLVQSTKLAAVQEERTTLKRELAEKSQALLSQEQARSLQEAELKKLRLEYKDLRRTCFHEHEDVHGNVTFCSCTCQESQSNFKLF